QYHKAQTEINDTFMFYKSMLEERKQELLKEVESVYSAKQISLEVGTQKGQETVDQIYKTCEFVERLNKCATVVEIIMFRKLLDTKLQGLLNYSMEQSVQLAGELEFVSNYQAIQVGVRNTFGYVRSNSESVGGGPVRQPPIARPTGGGSSSSGSSVNGSSGSLNGVHFPITGGGTGGGGGGVFHGAGDPYSMPASGHNDMLELTSKLMSTAIFPPKSQIKRQKMIYHCKFGEFGVMEGQFTEPSGVAVNAQNDIIVADTNNHRIQIFDKEGRFKFQFGECGKRDGQLLYPNRVAVVRTSGDIIVTERSPTHQIQIYNQYGQFVRKFGANILQHPRGVTVDNKGRIVVVECKVMSV
nr:brain tumor [Cucujiformia]